MDDSCIYLSQRRIVIIVTSAEAGINTALQGKNIVPEKYQRGGDRRLRRQSQHRLSNSSPHQHQASKLHSLTALAHYQQSAVARRKMCTAKHQLYLPSQTCSVMCLRNEYTEELCHEQGCENIHRTSSPILVPLIDICLGLFSSLILAWKKKINEIIALESPFIFVQSKQP